MESKNLNKKIGTIYWWFIYSFPIIMTIASVIMHIVSTRQTGVISLTNYNVLFDNTLNTFSNFVIPGIRSTLVDLFSSLSGNSSTLVYYCSAVFGWLIQMHIIHMGIDLLLYLPRFGMKYIDKGVY